MQSTKKIWDTGEVVAIKYLQKKWYIIKTSNFKFSRFWEIDIIAEKNWITIFFEVKYRVGTKFGLPEEAITKSKLRKSKRTIDYYCVKNNIDFEKIRFDVIAIVKNQTSYRLTHYKNISISL